MNVELTAIYDREKFRFQNADGDTLISSVVLEDETMSATKGPDLAEGFQCGAAYRFFGQWSEYTNKRTGDIEKQFAYKTCVKCAPFGRHGIVKYLQTAPGIGPATAKKLWDKFGADAVKVLREKPHTVDMVSQKVAAEASEYLQREFAREACVIDLMELLDGQGFPKKTTAKAIEKWGNQAAQWIRKNPYLLMQFRGIGFKRCDQLYAHLGLPMAALKRQALCAWYGVSQAHQEGGDTWADREEAVRMLHSNISGADVRVKDAIGLALRGGILRATWTDGSRGPIDWDGSFCWLADARKARSEAALARDLADAVKDRAPIQSVSVDGLSPHQQEKIEWLFRQPGCVKILGGGPGVGKAQPLTAEILTDRNWTQMGDVKVGDKVVGSDGKFHSVIGVYPQGKKEVFEVTFSDGSKARCCKDHLWLTSSRRERLKGQTSVKTLEEIMNSLDRGDGSPNHRIPMVAPVESHGSKSQLPLHPYVMGVLLGDGCFRGPQVSVSNPDADIILKFQKLLPEGHTLTPYAHSICDYGIRNEGPGNKVKDAIRKLGLDKQLSSDKFIPVSYLFADLQDRLALLHGLLDTDGYAFGINNIEYCTTSESLAHDIKTLVQSLGGVVSIAIRNSPTYEYAGEKRTGKKAYRVLVKVPPGVEPFSLRRKLKKHAPRTKYPPRRYILSVESVGLEECQCIEVDSPDGLYVTSSYILTHNTFSVARIVKHLSKVFGIGRIALAAPTGKAAVRMTEAMQEYGVPLTARTWHSLLGVQSASEGEGWGFVHGREYPLPFRVVIGDEQSMQDTDMASRVFEARERGTLFLLVGDVNQLPPVGHGAPLRDMIAAGIPYAELTEVRRNSGEIVEQCRRMREDGVIEIYPDPLDLESGRNLRLLNAWNSKQQIDGMLAAIQDAEGFDPVWQVQVLTPTNKSGDLGRKNLNKILQNQLNPNPEIKGSPFREGDKVVCLKNSWFSLVEGDDDVVTNDANETYVANGDVGKVASCEPKVMTVELSSPYRLIRVGRGQAKEDTSHKNDSDAPDKEDEDPGTGCNWDLAYALSVHKAQGSESPVVIVMLDDGAGARRLCSREWIYTAISRARQYCVCIGREGTAIDMVRKTKVDQRKTFLRELIESNIKG